MEDIGCFPHVIARVRYHKEEANKQKNHELEFETGNSEEYQVEAIWDSTVYANKTEDYLPGLYYLVA